MDHRELRSPTWNSVSASALPLRLRDVTLGALNLLSVTRAPMEEAGVIVAQGLC